MARRQDDRPISHPCIIEGPYMGRYLGRGRMIVKIRCPKCLEVRERTASEIHREMKRSNFHGYCRPCSFKAVRDGEHRWFTGKSRDVPNVNGYALVTVARLPDKLLPLYRIMQTPKKYPVLEHRWVMACHLGRPLESNELVDHRNGKKRDNRIENLRLYIRGKNTAGSANGYGTYYHEWQMAETRVRELEALLAKAERRLPRRLTADDGAQFLPLFKVSA